MTNLDSLKAITSNPGTAVDFYAAQYEQNIAAAKNSEWNKAIEAAAKVCDGKRLSMGNSKKDTESWRGGRFAFIARIFSFGGESISRDCATSIRKLKRTAQWP